MISKEKSHNPVRINRMSVAKVVHMKAQMWTLFILRNVYITEESIRLCLNHLRIHPTNQSLI